MQSARMATKPSKQRKMLHQATDHVRHKLFAAHLSPELRASHLVKTFPARSGDAIRVMRGDHKGFEGKITRIDKKKYRIYVEGLTREKVDGTTIFLPIHPSKVMITNLNLDDKWRKKILERKKLGQAKPKETQRKPKERPRAKPEEPAKMIETQPPAAEEKAAEKKGVGEQEPLLEEKPIEEKMVTEEKPRRKKAARKKKRTTKKATAQDTKVESKKPVKERKPKTEKKKAKRNTTEKTRGEE
jgi:large subunit ribosomal protein L24